jgi:Spy/CpxP family protein refolding chaperone
MAAVLALGVTAAALAQDTPPPPPDQAQGQPGRGPMRMDPDRQLEHMTKELDLSADQQSQIKPLLVERQQKMQATFQDQSLSREDRRAKMQAIRADSQGKIEAVLNDQQKQKFEAMQQRMGRRGGENGGPPPPESAPQPQ